MKRRNQIHLILLIVVIGLTAAVWLMPNSEKAQIRSPLTQLDPLAVTRIQLANNNGPSFELTKAKGKWQMQSPYQIEANTPRIEILLDLVSTPSLEQLSAPTEEREQFGLDKPRATIEFNNLKLVMGGTHPYNYRRYMEIGNQLHLINDIFPHHLLAVAEDFVSHAIFRPNEEIVGIKTDRWALEKNTDGPWKLTPNTDALSEEALALMVEEWNQSWAKKVIKIPKKGKAQKIELTLSNLETPLIVEIIQKKKEIILIRRDRGVAYRLPPASIFHISTEK